MSSIRPSTGRKTSLNATGVKEAAAELAERVSFTMSPTAWRFEDSVPADAVSPNGRWTCMFSLMRKVQAGRPLSITGEATGCPGAGFYLGLHGLPLMGACVYLSSMERLKQDLEKARAFYLGVQPVFAPGAKLLYERVDSMPGAAEVEVVNLWVKPAGMSSLLTLANYDREDNENVIMPFASGCQSIWSLPYKEKNAEAPRAVAGSLDPTVRKFLPPDTLSFAVPANRFMEMCANIEESFLGAA